MIGGRAGTNRYRVLDDGKRRNEKQEDGGKLSSRGGLSVKVCEDEMVFLWVVWEPWLRLRVRVHEMTSSFRLRTCHSSDEC